MCGAFGTFAHRAYADCLRGRLNSNVRPHMHSEFVARRILLVAFLPSLAMARPRTIREWMIGHWIADGQRNAAGFAPSGQTLNEERRKRLAIEFGKMYYKITTRTFTFGGWSQADAMTATYSVISETDSSVTLGFGGKPRPPNLTLYRETEDSLFIRSSDKNFEYLKRSTSGAA